MTSEEKKKACDQGSPISKENEEYHSMKSHLWLTSPAEQLDTQLINKL